MKTNISFRYQIIFLVLSFFVQTKIQAQNPLLLDTNWYAAEIYLNGTTYQRPEPTFQSLIYFQYDSFQNQYVLNGSNPFCENFWGMSNVVFDEEQPLFAFEGEMVYFGGNICVEFPVLNLFAGVHGSIYVNNNAFTTSPYTFEVTQNEQGSGYQLVITNALGNWARYDNALLSAETPSTHYFSIYPNPTKDFLHLKASQNNALSKVQIFDLQGKKIYERKLDASEHVIDVKNFENGIYLIVLENQSGSVEMRKFIKS